MSDPNVSVERQARRHRPAIWAIIVALVAATLALFVFGAFDSSDTVEDPVGTVPPAVDQTAPAATAPSTTTAPATTAPASN